MEKTMQGMRAAPRQAPPEVIIGELQGQLSIQGRTNRVVSQQRDDALNNLAQATAMNEILNEMVQQRDQQIADLTERLNNSEAERAKLKSTLSEKEASKIQERFDSVSPDEDEDEEPEVGAAASVAP